MIFGEPFNNPLGIADAVEFGTVAGRQNDGFVSGRTVCQSANGIGRCSAANANFSRMLRGAV